jgi:HK97 family phage major capsid protein
MPPVDASGTIPVTYSNQIIQAVTQQSAALALGRRVPMGSGIASVPVAGAFPSASFISTGGRKPFTDFKLTNKTLTAEEVAAVIAIPQAYLDDSSVDLWAYARPLLAQAIAVAVDDAILWGHNNPPSYPTGGVTDPAYSTAVAPGTDALESVNAAMGAVEAQGLPVTGHAADIVTKAALRGVRDAQGALLLGPAQADNPQMSSIYGVPVMFNLMSPLPDRDFITGDWNSLLIGVRQDITYDLSSDGVLVDENGAVVVSAFQDDQMLMRVHARFGCVIAQPVTPRAPNGAKPFAYTDIANPTGGAAQSASSGSTSSSGSRASTATK